MKIINEHNSHSVYGSSMSVTRCSSLQPFVSDSSERERVFTQRRLKSNRVTLSVVTESQRPAARCRR